MASFDEFYNSLPEDSNKKGEYFEKVFVPWFLKTDPVWSTKVNQIWLWDDYPQRWGKDCGIDLVFEDYQGKHWAIQSKCVSPDRDITKAEIDSFLSESSDSRIHGRLLIASTDGIGRNAEQVLERQEKKVVRFLLDHFRHSEVDFPTSPEDLSKGHRKEKRTPRPHQQEAIKNVVEGLQKEDRGQLLMACGTGKTLTSLWIKEALKAKRTLVLLPSLSLLSQTLREWSATSQEKFNWICVCSDKSVAKQDKSTDSMIENISALGVPVTSDPKDIQDFLLNEDGGIVFSTYQSSPLVEESQRSLEVPAFDIAFADEAHRCAGKVSSAFASILDEQKIRSKKRLFMTATPRVLSKQIKKKADDENINLACMDDVSQFGEVFHQLNFSKAIEKELLSDYQVVIVGVDDPSVQAQIIDRMLVDTGNECNIDTETLANHIALAKAIKDYDLNRMITFHSRVKSAKKFSEDHPLILDWIPEESKSSKSAMTSYVSGEMNAKNRNTEISKLRNISEQEVGILANARCLSEGGDVPTLDGIAFFDPRSSQVDIIQAVGRAIRKSENKTDGYIILPVYLGDTTNIEDEILQSRFKDIWSIILALKSQDDSMRDELDQLRVELGRRNAPTESVKGLTKIVFDLPSSISTTFADSLTTILVRETTENWMEMYGQLKQYIEDHCDSNVPQKHSKLGVWINSQRTAKNNGKLSTERIQLLDAIGFTWDQIEQVWQENYQQLKQYALDNGNTKIPIGHLNLGTWVNRQRRQQKKNELSEERIQLLNDIGFIWDAIEQEWQENYQQLKQYALDNGNTKVPGRHLNLGKWVNRQRQKQKKNELSEERIQLLNDIGFIWDPFEEEWQENYQQLKQYALDNGNTKVPRGHLNLGTWVSKQRQQKKKDELSEERIQLLNDIGFIWDPFEQEWQENYQQLKQYALDNGNTKVPRGHLNLGKWVSSQRQQKKKDALSEERIQLLNDIGFIWDPFEQEWQEKYQQLKQYSEENGDSNVPQKHPQLGNWVSAQRQQKKKDELSEERIQLLNDIGFIWDPFEQEWQENYQQLKQYALDNGNTKVPIGHPYLGTWVSKQRQQKKKDELSQERIQLLNDIGFIWDPFEEEWQENYQQLKQYALDNGNTKVPRGHLNLGTWVSKQRQQKKKDELSQERTQLLDDIGFIWDVEGSKSSNT